MSDPNITDGPKVRIKDVQVLMLGTFNGVEFDEAALIRLANGYNADRHEAQLVLGHDRSHERPANLGAISQLEYRAPYLYADLDRVPKSLADEMLHGKSYPYRSVEVSLQYTETEDGWYKAIPSEMLALAILGSSPPAVRGMRKVTAEQIEEPDNQYMQVVGFAQTGNWLQLAEEHGVHTLHEISQFTEEPAMADNGKIVQEETVSLSEFEALKLKADTLLKEKEDREAKLAEAEKKAATVEQENVELAGAVTKLTESTNYLLEKASLAEKQARLSEAERFIEKLCVDKGGSVAALANTNIVGLLAELDGSNAVMKLADDTEVRLADELRTALSAIPKFDGEIEIAPVTDDQGDGVHLSDTQKALAEVARIVAGVTTEKFAAEVEKTASERGGK